MCGLIGGFSTPGVLAEQRLRLGLAALRHRGPDHQALRVLEAAGRQVWLGHARLSVIDLADEANQPMGSEDGRFMLVFNGEIYNYIELRAELQRLGATFKTSSDTEVLLAAWAQWGEGCLHRLDGMFAFVVLDRTSGTLTCVRDPFGIKPFFYRLVDGAFYFASELPALVELLPSRPDPDLQRAYDYLVHGDYDSSENTFVEGVRRLMPAHIMTLDVARCSVVAMRRWWKPDIDETCKLAFHEAADAVRQSFLHNVRMQLRSDVPLGAALSGGIDSSAVVCAIRHLEPDASIHTFSYIASDAALSEEHWVDQVNQHVGATAHKVQATAVDLARDIDEIVRAQGEPFGSTSIYAQYRVFQAAREAGITVTLDGQGADELLAGYSGYPGYRTLSYLSDGALVGAWRFARAWCQWPGRGYGAIARDVSRVLLPDGAYACLRSLAGRDDTPRWLDVAQLSACGVRTSLQRPLAEPRPRGRFVTHRLRSSLQYQGLPGLLRHGDRNSMRFAIESRVPFLSTGLCELLYSMPERYLISPSGETKSVFRQAMRGIVPDAILDRKDKIGFATPERNWLQSLLPVLRGWLADASAVPFLRADEVAQVSERILANPQSFNWQVWRLVNYIRWWNLLYADVSGPGNMRQPAVATGRGATRCDG